MAGRICWAMTTGETGMVNQAMGLAEAVGFETVAKVVGLRAPWRWLPGHRCPSPMRGLTPDSDTLEPPWPDLLITCGRRSVALSHAIRRLSRGRTFTVHVQDPRVPPSCFDLVIPPRHDGLAGPNVYPSSVALHRLTGGKLDEAAARLGKRFAHLPRPRLAVLIGGTSKTYRFTPGVAAHLCDQLASLARDHHAGLMVTASRRTGAENIAVLRNKLAGLPCELWAGDGENPYFAMLGLADTILVTADSISMVSEACFTGKPVYVIELEGGNVRFERFHQWLRQAGITRPFGGTLEQWTYTPPDSTREAARVVLSEMAKREERLRR